MTDHTTGAGVNKAFLAKAIDRAQRLSIEDRFCQALNEFIMRAGALFWDDVRALFWVKHPQSDLQVAVWMMPVALLFTPTKKEPEND